MLNLSTQGFCYEFYQTACNFQVGSLGLNLAKHPEGFRSIERTVKDRRLTEDSATKTNFEKFEINSNRQQKKRLLIELPGYFIAIKSSSLN